MMRKLLIVVLCGFVQRSACSRVKFEQTYHEPIYRHDPHIHNEAVCKREHFFPRDSIIPPDQMLPQQNIIRSEPFYGNEPIVAPPQPQQTVIPNDYFSNEHIMQSDPILRNEPFIRSEPILRREPFIRREPILRREAFIRTEPVMRSQRIYQNPQMFRDGGIFRNEPNPYAVMVSQYPCQEQQSIGQPAPQESFFQIPQSIQPMQQQPIVAHRLIFQKPMIKPQAYQPVVTFPRIQRYMRKNFKPITENIQPIQFSTPAVQSTPVQQFPSFGSEPVSFQENFQNQGQEQENTSEPSQNNPVTVRNLPQMANPLTLAQMSSIC